MKECIAWLGKAQVCLTLVANSAYWQTKLDEQKCEKSTFTLHYGLYRFIRMLFGLKNATSTFQRSMDVIKSKVKKQLVLTYLDDIAIIFKSIFDHRSLLRSGLGLFIWCWPVIEAEEMFIFRQKHQLPCSRHKVGKIRHLVQRSRFHTWAKATDEGDII